FEAEPASLRLGLTHLQHWLRVISVEHDGEATKLGHDLAQEFKPLAGKLVGLDRQPGRVAPGIRKTGDQTAPNRVYSYRKYNWDNRRRLLHNRDGASDCDNHIDIKTDKLGCNFSVALGTAF